jgi:uncharacterized protein YbjT (DUF2867 family)
MRVLVLAAHGKLGRVVAERLAADGHEVRGFVRRLPDKRAATQIEYFQGDAFEQESVFAALSGQDLIVNTNWPRHESLVCREPFRLKAR